MVLAAESPYQLISNQIAGETVLKKCQVLVTRSVKFTLLVRAGSLKPSEGRFGLVELRRWRRLDGLLPGIPPINSKRHSHSDQGDRKNRKSVQILLDKLREMMLQRLPSEQVVFRNLIMCYKQQLSSTQRVVCRFIPQEKNTISTLGLDVISNTSFIFVKPFHFSLSFYIVFST